MKEYISNIKADRLTFRGFIISIFLTFLTVVYILVYYRSLPPFVPVFNQFPWGNERLTPQIGIFIPVIIFAIILILNIIFTSIVYSKNPLIARIFAAVTLLLSIMNFLFIIRTVVIIV